MDDVSAGLRQPASPATERVTPGGSWWLGKSREELSQEAAARATKTSKTAVGRTVRGRINTP